MGTTTNYEFSEILQTALHIFGKINNNIIGIGNDPTKGGPLSEILRQSYSIL